MSRRRLLGIGASLLLIAALFYGLNARILGFPSVSTVLDPADGFYRTARNATPDADSSRLQLSGLEAPVTIVRDERHVPHIYAESDRDAIVALGYVTAKDRLFQLDFLPRVASGRLSEAFGRQAVGSDRFLRRTGMEWGAQRNLERIQDEGGVELQALRWYGEGVNAYLDRISSVDLPLEFRLLGYTPDRFSPIQGLRLLQYMTYDLTYNTDDPAYARLQRRLDSTTYETLYPEHPAGLFVPVIPPDEQVSPPGAKAREETGSISAEVYARAAPAVKARDASRATLQDLLGLPEDAVAGSNNWAVQGERSDTGAPLLAGDMHLSVTLPSIWYEAHLVTPSTNVYGLTIPGAPVLVQAFNRHVGWTMTNTGADQIDHYALEVDSTRSQYRYEGDWRPLRREVDTLHIKGEEPVLDTLYFSHHGPVRFSDTGKSAAIAERWVGHEPSRTLHALWDMNRARSAEEVSEALRLWDTPMQNVLYAGTDDSIAIRSVGYLPVRRGGHGRGLLDGSSTEAEWIGRVPFDSLPAAHNPSQKFLASANQVPTGPGYPYYLGHDWGDGYRSLRIDSLLRGASSHSVDDFKRYQGDVQVQEREVFVPFLTTLEGLSPRADTLRRLLRRWDGEAATDRPEPLILEEFLSSFRRMMWDEPIFAAAPNPEDAALVHLLRTNPDARWFDVQATDSVEDASALLSRALEATADTMAATYGWTPSEWRWGEHHELMLRHLSGSDQLRPLWRGPYAFPGFGTTVLQAPGHTVTHTASQRVIVDFSTTPPRGYGVVPGGQRGDPLDPFFYDTQIPTYLDQEYFDLQMPETPRARSHPNVRAKQVLHPAGAE